MPLPHILRDPWTEVKREFFFASLALTSILIGLSRVADSTAVPTWVKVLDAAIAATFFMDWLRRVATAERHAAYAARHAYEFIFFVPFTLLPSQVAGGDIFRGARLFRLVRALRYARFAKVGLGLARLPRRLRHVRRVAENAQVFELFAAGLVMVSLGAAALLYLERGVPGVVDYGDAWWWSLSLFTTAAYAVPEPTTTGGFLVTGALMTAGVLFIGIFAASLASAIVRTPSNDEAA